MPEQVVYYVTRYGYLAIFVLVFLQEIGMPNPFPNELLLMFSGYLSFKGLLFLPYVILTVVCADFIGTNILYFIFYSAGAFIMQKKPKWIPLSDKMISRLSDRISKGGQLRIYIFRVTPFTRGYASVITGLLQIKPVIFLPLALISGFTWALVYVVIGYCIGPSWDLFTESIGSFKYLLLIVMGAVLSTFLFVCIIRNRRQQKNWVSPGEVSTADKNFIINS
jgi:membrane protein DedA with SNARE-associated domain